MLAPTAHPAVFFFLVALGVGLWFLLSRRKKTKDQGSMDNANEAVFIERAA